MIPLKSLENCAGLRIAVGIATRGRARILAETIDDLRNQIRDPDSIFVAYSEAADIGDAPDKFPEVSFIRSPLGLTRQRNAILDQLALEDVVLFLDDDFYLRQDYLAAVESAFLSHSAIVAATGNVLKDGIGGPGLEVGEARSILAASLSAKYEARVTRRFNAYGCNMILRMDPIRAHRLRFDENLPLYGWYEDVEFSRQLAPHGEIVQVENALGVHLGVKSGRQSGLRLGYSQIANPVYLARKGAVPWTYAIASMTSRSMKNLVKSAAPEPFVDRQGRLRGNLRGWWELLTNAISPNRIVHL